MFSKVLSLDLLSCPQIWNIEQEKDGEKIESTLQASEAQRQKGRQRSRARDKKTKETTYQVYHGILRRIYTTSTTDLVIVPPISLANSSRNFN